MSDSLKGHVCEVSLALLQNGETTFTKFRLIIEDFLLKTVVINFYDLAPMRTKYVPWLKNDRPMPNAQVHWKNIVKLMT